MNTGSKLLIVLILNLLAFESVEARQTASTSSAGESGGNLTTFDLSKIDEGVTREFKNAWEYSRCGTADVEALVFIFRNSDGSYRARSLPPNNEFDKITFKWDPDAIAVVHTHPTKCNPRPTTNDIQVADGHRVPMFTITVDGMYMYDPGTKRITRVQSNLDWLKAERFVSGSIQSALGPERHRAVSLGTPGEQALRYFAKVEAPTLDNYLRSVRTVGISAAQRARLVASIRKEDIIAPSPERQAKLDALRRVLDYHERSAIEVRILRLGLAWAGFLEGAAIMISEEALDLLTADELQAVIAHELGHEYFAAEYDPARRDKQYDKVKEVELRCDGVSIITMKSLGLNPELLVSAVTRLTEFNDARGARSSPSMMPALAERVSFCHAMIEFAESGDAKHQSVAKK